MTIIYFILILGIIVLVHELGHLITAKMFGVYCREFAIGMGPKVKSIQGKETVYSIRALPLGGFVSMAGEEGVDIEGMDPKRTLKGIAHWKRIIIMLSGIIMNMILAWVIFVGIFVYQGERALAPEPVIAGIVENSVAQQVGLETNDRIVRIEFHDGTKLVPKDFYEIITFTQLYGDHSMTYVIDREGTTLTYQIQPLFDETEGRYMVGLLLPRPQIVQLSFFDSIVAATETTFSSIRDIFTTLSRLIRGIGLGAISGPLGIYDVTAQQASAGILSLIALTALLSINVGIFNLLPLPLLDGGRVILTLVEMITRRPVNAKIEQALMMMSMLLVIALMVFVTWQDIVRLFS